MNEPTGCVCPFPAASYPFRCPGTGRERMTEGRHRQCATVAGYFDAMGGGIKQPEESREPRKPPQRAEDCTHGGDVDREVECRVCSRETVLRPVYRCEMFGEAMNRRNEHDLHDCSRCTSFILRTATNPPPEL